MRTLFISLLLSGLSSMTMINSANLFIEAESFAKKGGWVVDQQFMDLMGSSYLMAHGMGERKKERIMYMYGHITGLRLGKMEKDRENSACMSVTRSWLHHWGAKGILGCGKQPEK